MNSSAGVDAIFLKAAELERAIRDFYLALAKMAPRHAEFFQGIAAEEDEHADALTSFADIIDANSAELNPQAPNISIIDKSIADVRNSTASVIGGNMTFKWALQKALEIEASLFEMEYARQLIGTTESVCTFLDSIKSAEQEHSNRLKQFMEDLEE